MRVAGATRRRHRLIRALWLPRWLAEAQPTALMSAVSTPTPSAGERERCAATLRQPVEHCAPEALRAPHRRADCLSLGPKTLNLGAQRARCLLHACIGPPQHRDRREASAVKESHAGRARWAPIARASGCPSRDEAESPSYCNSEPVATLASRTSSHLPTSRVLSASKSSHCRQRRTRLASFFYGARRLNFPKLQPQKSNQLLRINGWFQRQSPPKS